MELPKTSPGELERQQIPPAIQPHGVLLAVRCSDLQVMHASANAPEIFGGDAIADLLENATRAWWANAAMATIRATLTEEQYSPAVVTINSGYWSSERRFEVVAHKTNDLILCRVSVRGSQREGEILSARVQRTIQNLRAQKVQRELWKTAVAHLRTPSLVMTA